MQSGSHGIPRSKTPQDRAIRVEKLRTTINAAKKEHMTQKIEAMNTPADIFKLMEWSSPRKASIPLSLACEIRIITYQAERAKILLDKLLARYQVSDDHKACNTPSNNRIRWDEEVTYEIFHASTIGCACTAHGAGGVSMELLTNCWNTIGPCV